MEIDSTLFLTRGMTSAESVATSFNILMSPVALAVSMEPWTYPNTSLSGQWIKFIGQSHVHALNFRDNYLITGIRPWLWRYHLFK